MESKVGKIISKLTIKIICVLFLPIIAACDFNMDGVDGLKVGLSYRETLKKLSVQRIQNVIPAIRESVVVKYDQIDKIYKLRSSSGICLNDNRGLRVSIDFNENNILTEARASPVSKLDQIDFEVGREKDDVLGDIKILMEGNKEIVASSCIYDLRWVNITEVSDDDFEYLSRYPVIQYHYPDLYSYTTLKFENQALAQMTYHWRPFEE
jgi:hypothetical protein